ncbi:MAG: hypothetical protein KA715_05485 [Xanthomonadaceae bacterium]|nr:hypothetical protein [Xanthomonadaceae bacterium]
MSSSASSLSDNEFESSWYYFNRAHVLGIEVFYEPGAEPYVGLTDSGTNSMPYWQILESNIQSLFQTRAIMPLFQIPKNIENMTQIEAQSKASWNDEEIYSLGTQLRKSHAKDGETRFVILFLKGNYNDGKKILEKVQGIAAGGTRVIGIFKQVIIDSFTEQSTLVNKMVYSLGLVNNGLPMIAGLKDFYEGHGEGQFHCDNPNCVMHWTSTNPNASEEFWDSLKKSGLVSLFGDECLKDARLYTGNSENL